MKWGVGGINIDACRIKYTGKTDPRTFGGKWKTNKAANNVYEGGYAGESQEVSPLGRFPANFIHDGSEEVLELFPDTKSGAMNSVAKGKQYNTYGKMYERNVVNQANEGSAARFFYCAKASSKERNYGLEEMPDKPAFDYGSIKKSVGRHGENTPRKNHHPTYRDWETQQQADILKKLGCNQLQGYLLGRPVKIDSLVLQGQPHFA